MDSSNTTTGAQDHQESNTIKFEWTLRGLKNLFESSSKGDAKSKVTKSVRFGGGRWQILFYANSGTVNPDGHSFMSLYLACEPTAEEKEEAVDGKWIRQGLYRFGFELRNLQRTLVFNSKEAHDHSFSHKTQNWGWAQFARRDLVYYQTNSVRQQDALLIICNITSSPYPPAQPLAIPRQPVPRDLLDALGGLLDDPTYSDVEFVLPRRGQTVPDARRIYATRTLLQRVPYFHSMFHSGFAEAAPSDDHDVELLSSPDPDDEAHFLDSDDEDDNLNPDDMETYDGASDATEVTEAPERDTDNVSAHTSWSIVSADAQDAQDPPQSSQPSSPRDANDMNESDEMGTTAVPEISRPPSAASSTLIRVDDGEREERRNVRAKLSHPSSPSTMDAEPVIGDNTPEMGVFDVPAVGSSSAVHLGARTGSIRRKSPAPASAITGPRKTRVVVRDASYATYRAVLYYIYTDTITFAPLASSFLHRPSETDSANIAAPDARPHSRTEWLAQWDVRHNTPEAPSRRPQPCSAKAVYRLADRLDLPELKARAFRYIVRSLSPENIAYEAFSPFAAAFVDVRKVMVRYFLDNWAAIRGSESMRNVWAQIRVGRHPGFEEVWPTIALSLEYNARAAESEGGQGQGQGVRTAAGVVVHVGES
ncbi:hypothetical protein CERSUDRAFT_163065 [Gelatoporia subvermispora B]|uniref:MATH domain-containing protein n=1 Tax=Ceriporiopsis subvermispora (strain B) TaxID=914234 RepID=M2QHB1_CERS8|nr:hypothetical protein CERSUDRAFT_163065 [Gelatoporia subvermispora B]